MPTSEKQHTYFHTFFMILIGILVANLLITMLFSVFDFYDFDYKNFYSVIIFYLFMLSCLLILPKKMPHEIVGLENITPSISSLTSTLKTTVGLAPPPSSATS